VAFLPFNVSHEAHTAGIVLAIGLIHTMLARQGFLHTHLLGDGGDAVLSQI
jgi:hypothetical protein